MGTISNSNIVVNEFMRVLNNYPTDHIFLGSDWHLFKKEVTGLQENEIKSQLNNFIKLHNSKINKNDIFIYLGDLLHRNCKQEHFTKLKDFISKLNGIKILIKGNHDLKPDEFYIDCGFNYVCDNLQINDVIFTHKPCDLKDFPDAKINVHGHMHEENFYDVNTNDDHIKIYTPDHDILSLKSVLKKESTETNKPVDKNLISDYVKELKSKYQKMVDKFFKENPKYKEMPLEEIYKNQEKISREFIKKSGIKETEGFTLSIRRHQTNDEEFKKYPKLDTQKNFYRVVIYDRDNNIVIDLFPQLQNQKTHVKHDMEDLTKNFWKTYTNGYSNKTYRKDDVIKFYKTQLESVKEDDMNIATLNKDDLTEQTVTESKIFNKPNFEINIDKWGYGNPLWITGGSGDGKSTLAENMAKQHNAIHVNLDIFLIRCTGTPEKFQKMLHDPMIGNSTILLDYINQHPEIPWRNVHTWEYDMTSECADLFKWILNAAKTKYRNKLLIVEGCDICRMNPKLACTLPLIVIGVSELTQSLHRIKRDTTELDDNGQHKHGIIDAIFRELRRRTRYGNLLNQYKYDFLKNVKSTLNESTELQLEIYEAERNGKITLQERNMLLSIYEKCKDVDTARKFVSEVKELAKKYDANFFIVTDGASGIRNNGNPAVKNARDAQIEWEKKNGFDPDEDWSKDTNVNESLETLLTTNPLQRTMTLYHGSLEKGLKSIEPMSKNFGTKISGLRYSSFWTPNLTDALHRCVYKMLRQCGYRPIINANLSFTIPGEYPDDEYDKFIDKIKTKPMYIYQVTLSKHKIKCGQDKWREEYSVDKPVTPDACHEISFEKYKTLVSPNMIHFGGQPSKPYESLTPRKLGNILFRNNVDITKMNQKFKTKYNLESTELQLEIYEAERNGKITLQERNTLLNVISEKTSKKEQHRIDNFLKKNDYDPKTQTIKSDIIGKDGKPTRIPFKMTNKPDKEAESYKKRDGSYGIEMPRTTIKRKPAISQGTLKHEEGHIAQWIDPEKYSKYHKQVQLFIDSIDKDCFDHDLEIEEYIADLYAKKHSGYGVSGIEKTLNSLRTTTHQIHQVIKKMDKFTDKDVEDNYQGYLNKLESDMSMIKLIEQTMEHRKKLLNDYVKKASLEKSSDYDDYIKRLEAWISDNEKTLKRAHELYDKAATNLNSVKNDKISAYKKDLVLKKSNALNNKLTNKNLLDNGIDARIKYQKMTEAVELKLEIYEAERNEEINIHERDFLLSILESSSADQYFKFFDWVKTLTTIKPSDITKILAFTKKNRNDVYIANLNPAGLHVELKLGSYVQKAPITWACRSDEWIEPEMWENLKSFITNHKTILNSKNVIQHVNKVYGFSICDKINIWDAMMYVEYIELSPWSDKITVVCGNSWDKEHEVIIYVENNKIEHLD